MTREGVIDRCLGLVSFGNAFGTMTNIYVLGGTKSREARLQSTEVLPQS